MAISSCSTQKYISPINVTESSFLTSDSVFSVTPSYELGSNYFDVVLNLKKIKDSGEYYFPSSENLRVIIKDKRGETILNTAGNENFFTAITPLEPQKVGDEEGYGYHLNGIPLFENNDQITLILILPVKPHEIYFEKTIKLGSNE